MRVRVPLGRRCAIGCIDRISADSGRESVRNVLELLDSEPILSSALLELARWIADYYAAPLGLVLRAALPPGLLGKDSRRDPRRHVKVVQLIRSLPTLLAREEEFGRARRQLELYEQLESLGGQASLAHLEGRLGFGRALVQGLAQRGLAKVREELVQRDPYATLRQLGPQAAAEARPVPTEAQANVIQALQERLGRKDPGVTLLRGVTGSGKTLVYLELLEHVRAAGRSGLVLVPEIALTPQTIHRFRARFGEQVAVLHSGLSAGERYDEWLALRTGRKRVAIGTRSAVFAPVVSLGLIVLDEEHDSSYKQSDTPRYHARSVAAMRARLEGAVCLLGSATPSLESWHNARNRRYQLLELPDRVTGHALPPVELVDIREVRALRKARTQAEGSADAEPGRSSGRRSERGPGPCPEAATEPVILSPRLRAAIGERLERGEQSILLLNRRGYSTVLECRDCGYVWSCPNCNVSLTWHRRRKRLLCHHCAHEAAVPETCGECASGDLYFSGLGTEQVERRVGEIFPGARILRMDVDTTGGKWAHAQMLERVRRREVDILLGTQMIAKGLDFPGVTLVGVINADVGLNLPDFRATERTFQLVAQVAGRAGRGPSAGEAIVQTARPGHFALRAAVNHDYESFAAQELRDREEPGYPPHRRLANVVVSGRNEVKVSEKAIELADWTRSLIRARAGRACAGSGRAAEPSGALDGDGAVEVSGPAPCPIDRLRDRWRWHYLLRSADPSALGRILRRTARQFGQPGGDLRIEIDRDPEALL